MSPARQIVPVLITLSLVTRQEGPTRLTLSLAPEELGRIEVAVERVGEGRLAITIVAERAETLHLLQRDSALLDRALTHVGLGSEGRSLAFAFGNPGSGTHGGREGDRGPARPGLAPAAPDTRPRAVATALLDIAV
ncbi:MAG: flagellar hook-length control protein FliK [Elioraea sp.]|nr:flagellar hook-length control protein FliK [Elioraea sp.]